MYAVIVGGGGSHATDCLLVFEADANWPSDPDRTRKEIRCVDGDPCDLDGTVMKARHDVGWASVGAGP